MDVATRPATTDDRAFAQRIHRAAYYEVVVAKFGSWDTELQARFFDEAWHTDDTEIVVLDGNPVDYWAQWTKGEAVHLRELVLAPTVQGRGVGTALVRRLQEVASCLGLPVELQVLRMNRAVELYQRLGFIETERTSTHIRMRWH